MLRLIRLLKSPKRPKAEYKQYQHDYKEKVYNSEHHDFIARALFPADKDERYREQMNYEEVCRELREDARKEHKFWLEKREITRAERRAAYERVQRRLYWRSLTYPEKAREHFRTLCDNTRVRDGAFLLLDKALEIILRHGMKKGEKWFVNMLSHDVTAFTPRLKLRRWK